MSGIMHVGACLLAVGVLSWDHAFCAHTHTHGPHISHTQLYTHAQVQMQSSHMLLVRFSTWLFVFQKLFCLCTYAHAHMHMHICTCTYAHMHICTYAHMHMLMHPHIQNTCTCTWTCTHTCSMYTDAQMKPQCTCTYAHMNTSAMFVKF